MGRLGVWNPETSEERLDRLESLAAIHELASRYAIAIDTRDLDALVALFEPDVAVGSGERGRDALRRWFVKLLSRFGTSIHFVGNHSISMIDADHAEGTVYTHDELDRLESDHWDTGMVLYRDRYVRVDGEWCFERRSFHRWYLTDALSRPEPGAGLDDPVLRPRPGRAPDDFETWTTFWDEVATG